MMLAGGRSLVAEHEAFRTEGERWPGDRAEPDFSLFNQRVGFIGYGQISRETHRLFAPFAPQVMAYDPYITENVGGVAFTDLETFVSTCRIVVVATVPSESTRDLLNVRLIKMLRPGALVIVISRAWSVDFEALMAAASAGRIQVAIDVFPDEPLAQDDPLSQSRNVILSPHRAAAVPGGRQLIGDMILQDVQAILYESPARQLKAADPASVAELVSAQRALKPIPNT